MRNMRMKVIKLFDRMWRKKKVDNDEASMKN